MSNGVNANGNEPFNGTSDTRFGRSVESQAQIHDAETLGSSDQIEKLNLYRLVPVAEPDDPRWQVHPWQGEIMVAARTSGDARIVAAGGELDFMELDALPGDDVTTIQGSAFLDEKLYTVIEVDHGREDFSRGVIEGTVRVDTIKPTQV